MSDAPSGAPGEALEPAGLARRMACFLYEGVLLFGVTFAAALPYAILTQQTNALKGRSGLIVVLFLVLAAYFLWLWTHGGQTLAMRTWRIRLVDARGANLGLRQALVRYLASWLWFLPPLVALWLSGLRLAGAYAGVPLLWIVLYAAATRLHPRRQFWHDALCGTELVALRPVARG